MQGLSQGLETGCPNLAIVSFLGVLSFKGEQYIERTTINYFYSRHLN